MHLEVQVYEGDGIEPEYMRQARLAAERSAQIEQAHLEWELKSLPRRLATLNSRVDSSLYVVCPICQMPRSADEIINRRRNTQYESDDSNWVVCCEQCFEEDNQNMKAQWDEYYSGVL